MLFLVLRGNVYSFENFNIDFDRGISKKQIKEILQEEDINLFNKQNPPVPISASQTFGNDKGLLDLFSGKSGLDLEQKEWTIMVYINGKNDLEQYALVDVNEMEKVGSDSKINIVVELGRMKGYYDGEGDWTGSKRYFIQRDFDQLNITSPIIEENLSIDMGDWNHLSDFAKWASTKYPAKHYMLIIWNHGTGWWSTKDVNFKGISYDWETNNYISTGELAQAMSQIGKVDILAFDACLMQMAEVMYEIKDYADVIVGSEEIISGYGFPYDTFLKRLIKDSEAGTEDIAKFLIEAVYNFYSKYKGQSTISAVRTSALPEFIKLVNKWADAAINSGDPSIFSKMAPLTKQYQNIDHKDLFDFVENITKVISNPDVIENGKKLMDYITNQLIIDNRATLKFGGIDNKSHGVAIYIPREKEYYYWKYDFLTWSVDSKWDDFLKFFSFYYGPK
jgi:hypothetical protein